MRFRQHHLEIGLLIVLLLWGCGSRGFDAPSTSSNPSPTVLEERKVEVTEVIPRAMVYTSPSLSFPLPTRWATIFKKK